MPTTWKIMNIDRLRPTTVLSGDQELRTPEIGREAALDAILADLRPGVKHDLSLARYRELASGYDGTCSRIEGIRAAAIKALGLRGGEHVADIACGTGATLVALARAVGPAGRVTGIELSPDMAELARARVAMAGMAAQVRIVVGPVENLGGTEAFDAFFLCYTHDVLQSPAAIAAMSAAAAPGARIVVVGARFLPWWWGFGVNLFTAYRARNYLTTYRGLGQPWRKLMRYAPDFHVMGADHFRTSYLGVGSFEKRIPVQSSGRHA